MKKTFVAARAGEIQTDTEPSQWRHIPGELNVADDVSRGLPVQELEGRWRQGPDFLCQPESEWPVDKSHQDMTEEITELKVKQVLTVTRKDIIDSTKFSCMIV